MYELHIKGAQCIRGLSRCTDMSDMFILFYSFLSKAKPIDSSLAAQTLSIGRNVERAANQRPKFYRNMVEPSDTALIRVGILGHRITRKAICSSMQHELYQRCRSLWQICALCWDTKRWEGARELAIGNMQQPWHMPSFAWVANTVLLLMVATQ